MHGKIWEICAMLWLGNIKENRPLRRFMWQNYTEMGLAAIE
jgi:hypothetical protein